MRLGRYFGNSAQFWLALQSQYDIAVVERERGPEIAQRVRPADAALKAGIVDAPPRSEVLLFNQQTDGSSTSKIQPPQAPLHPETS